jgi:hypothetical protein
LSTGVNGLSAAAAILDPWLISAIDPRIRHWVGPEKASHEMFECQFTNVPVGLFFQAQTCSV